MGSASLLQSFPATPDRPVPALWSQRLGAVQGARLWRAQRRVWWQLWANQAESPPFLVIEAERAASSPSPLPAQALRVGDLLVVAEDATARRQLETSLRPLQRRSRGGLPSVCLQRLQAGQAVYWNGAAFGVIVGQVSPLLERFGMGCLSLALEGQALRWQGEAGSPGSQPGGRHGLLPGRVQEGRPMAASLLTVPPIPALPPLPADQLLELEGASLDLLLRNLLEKPMIRDPLNSRYGLEGSRLARAAAAPFRLRLRPQPSGAFQASLELQVLVGEASEIWKGVLEKIAASLTAQGYRRDPEEAAGAPSVATLTPASPAEPAKQAMNPSSPPAKPAPTAIGSADPFQPTIWRRADGTAVGGWLWIRDQARSPQLLLFLGPAPLAPLPIPPGPALRPGTGELWMRLRPAALASLGLLPPDMPQLLQRSSQIWIEAAPLPGRQDGEPVSLLKGRLLVNR